MAAAEELLGTKGFHAASISDITRRAEVAQGTFYLYFDSKLEVFKVVREAEFVDEELFRWYYQRMADGYRRRLAEAQGCTRCGRPTTRRESTGCSPT